MGAKAGLMPTDRKGAVRGWGCWAYWVFLEPLPLILYLPGRYPDKGGNGPVRLRFSTGLNTIRLEFAPWQTPSSDRVGSYRWGLVGPRQRLER